MPPQKLPPKKPQPQAQLAAQKLPPKLSQANKPPTKNPSSAQTPKPQQQQQHQQQHQQQQTIPEKDVKQSSSVSAGMALEAGKKAYQLRQAAAAAGDPDAREEILGKAINKEIEAESFGKAAKYARSGAFQGLAAGAGIGIQPGATIGTLTGALVGGLLSTVGGLLGGGIGSAYGAISGPMWDLGGLASHGVRTVVGDFIGDWPDTGTSTKHQKDSLEQMVLGAQKVKKPSQGELEEMQADDGGASQESYQNVARDMTSYLPSMDSLPNFGSMTKNMPPMPDMQGASQSIAGMSSLQGIGGQGQGGTQATNGVPLLDSSKPAQQQSPGQNGQTSGKPPKLQQRPKVSPQAGPSTHTKPAASDSSQHTGTKKPPKLEKRARSGNNAPAKTPTKPKQQVAPKRPAPPKLEPRRSSALAGA